MNTIPNNKKNLNCYIFSHLDTYLTSIFKISYQGDHFPEKLNISFFNLPSAAILTEIKPVH